MVQNHLPGPTGTYPGPPYTSGFGGERHKKGLNIGRKYE